MLNINKMDYTPKHYIIYMNIMECFFSNYHLETEIRD